jgi:acyl-CoA thioesterase-1
VVALLLGLNLAGPAIAATAPPDACRVAVLGDSLTAGFGVALEDAFPARLEEALRARGLACDVLDAGVSGDTSAGGRSRLAWVLADQPTHLVVELGGNDGLRGLPVAQLEANLAAIIEEAQAAGVPVFLAGMVAPPNLGREYTEAFKAVYPRLAETYDVPLYPFFLEGAVLQNTLMQPDGIHPNPAGVQVIVDGIADPIADWLKNTRERSSR